MIEPAALWAMIEDRALQEFFPPLCISYAMQAYARAVNVCDQRGRSYRDIRVEVVGRLSSLPFCFDGERWYFHQKRSQQEITSAALTGRVFLIEDNGPPLEDDSVPGRDKIFLLDEVSFYVQGSVSSMITKYKFVLTFLLPNGTWREEKGEYVTQMAERFRQIISIQPPPKEARLYMDSEYPDGSKYQHDIAKFTVDRYIPVR